MESKLQCSPTKKIRLAVRGQGKKDKKGKTRETEVDEEDGYESTDTLKEN